MASIKFVETDLLWPEISVYVETALARWPLEDYAKKLGDVEISGVQCPCVVIEGSGTIWHQLRSFQPSGKKSTQYEFKEQPSKKIQGEYYVAYDDSSYINSAQIIFGHGFEKLRRIATVKWGGRRHWPNLFQVGYHIRNGSFHGNKFDFTVPILGMPSWRGLTITNSLQGRDVMGLNSGVIAFGDIPILLHDMLALL